MTKNLIFLCLIFTGVTLRAQTHTIRKNKYITTTLTLFVDTINKIDATDTSNIGFIIETIKQNKTDIKSSVDTMFFTKRLTEKPKSSFEHKLSRIKISGKNTYKHYLVYDSTPFKYYSLPKDSIILNGHFKIIDELKPQRNEPHYFSFEKTYEAQEKPVKNEGDWCGCCSNYTLPYYDFSNFNTSGYFSNGLKTGKWLFFEHGLAKTEEYYSEGLRNGLYTVFDKNKNILFETTFKNGTGIEYMYRSSGTLYHIKFFKNGILDYTKPYTIFYENGTVAVVYDYPNNVVKKYYRNGFIFSEQEFTIQDNVLNFHGVLKGYSEKKVGELREKTFYRDNILLSRTLYNYKNKITEIHTPNSDQYYKKGKLVEIHSKEMIQYFKKGKLIKTIHRN